MIRHIPIVAKIMTPAFRAWALCSMLLYVHECEVRGRLYRLRMCKNHQKSALLKPARPLAKSQHLLFRLWHVQCAVWPRPHDKSVIFAMLFQHELEHQNAKNHPTEICVTAYQVGPNALPENHPTAPRHVWRRANIGWRAKRLANFRQIQHRR